MASRNTSPVNHSAGPLAVGGFAGISMREGYDGK
jgi:hypothetical protein